MINQESVQHYAPIVLFVFNRPVHTRETVEALEKNPLAESSDLFIFSDAAKNNEDVLPVQKVREYIASIRGFKSIHIIEQQENLGLAASIINGVTSVVEKYGKVIVLEDDLETSPYFLHYMNDALALYSDEERVMHISASSYPVKNFCHGNSYFMNLPLCWGWATWDRAWSNFSKDITVMNQFTPNMISKFNFDDSYNYWSQLELNLEGRVNTWFIFWYATIFLSKGLSLFPKTAFVRNIGMDGTGVHCGSTNVFDLDGLANEYIRLEPLPLGISEAAYTQHKIFFSSINLKFYYRIIRKILLIIRRKK